MAAILDHTKLYRLPWTLPDNAISWLEPTFSCNLSCDGCYRANLPNAHKPMEQIRHELQIFKSLRKTDGISIAGGDPLLHPNIVDIVREIAADGLKPIVNTNGIALTKELLSELKKAGVAGFTFHIDSKQHRPHWKNKNELELNELRLHYAEMLAEVGGISCAFNATVYEDTLQYVPGMLLWAQEHIDIVNVMVFIAFRAAALNDFDYYAGAEKIDMTSLVYSTVEQKQRDIMSEDIVETIRTVYPDFSPCAYLNGTEKPNSFKWLLTGRIGTKERIYGYVGPKFIELAQTAHHLAKGRYLAYTKPSVLRKGKRMLFLSPIDRGLSQTLSSYVAAAIRNPIRLFKPLYFQSVMIIQPIDVLADGRMSMCDGCPDITVWGDEIVWSCRLEEQMHFGTFVRAVPNRREKFSEKELSFLQQWSNGKSR